MANQSTEEVWQRAFLRAGLTALVGSVPLAFLVGAALRVQWLAMPMSLTPRRIGSRSIIPKVMAVGAFAFGSLATTSLLRQALHSRSSSIVSNSTVSNPKVAKVANSFVASSTDSNSFASSSTDSNSKVANFVNGTKDMAEGTATGALLARMTAWRGVGALYVGLFNASLFVLADRFLYRQRDISPEGSVEISPALAPYDWKKFSADWLSWLPFMGEKGREIGRLQAILSKRNME